MSLEDTLQESGSAHQTYLAERVLISASAGSGKTYRLVHHFLGILYDALLAPKKDRQPRVVERVLAATFTRAAAGEIIDRILKRVADAMLNADERAALGKQLGVPALREEECGILLQALVAGLHRLRVCTLDSFLIRSAQAFSTELGLPDNWNILDDAGDRSVSLEAIDQLLTEKAADPKECPAMVELLLMLNQQRFTLQIRETLVDHLRATQPALMAAPLDAWEVIGPDPAHLMSMAQIDQFTSSFAADSQPFLHRTKAGAPHSGWVKAVGVLVAKAQGRNWESLFDGGLIGAMGKTPPIYSGGEIKPELVALLQPLRNHAAANLLALLRDRNLSTRALLTEFVREYKLAKSRRAAYRFDDFTHMLIDADVTENLADFYFRLDGSIDHILLDEFQDTSVPQWKLIKPLVDEIMSGSEGASGAQRTFFCVGDMKQTLYGWRNAEPELLKTLTSVWPDLVEEYLLLSQRSSPLVIETINEVFGSLVRNPVLIAGDDDHAYLAEAAEIWSAWFKDHKTAKKAEPSFCRLLTCADGETAADKQNRALELAADRVCELHKARPGAEIAVLVRRRRFIAPLLARLRRLDIAASGEGGSPLADDMAVCAVLSLLHLIDHPSDTAAVFHVGSSPLGAALGLSDKSPRNDILKKTTELRTEILDRGLGAAINRWLGLCAASCDARNFRRLQRLVSLAHGYAYDGGDLRPFIDTVRATNTEDSEASKVRVMTIHASKGRQFDFVILPDLDGRFIGQGPAVLMDRPDLLSPADCVTMRPSAAQMAVDDGLARLCSAAKRRQIVEELCALYVALTRAKTGLEMIVHPQLPGSKGNLNLPCSPAGVLRGALAGGAALPDALLWTQTDSVLPVGEAAVSATHDEPAAPLQVCLAPAAGSRLRPVIAPSALEGAGFVHLGRALTFQEFGGKDWGTVMHRWFQMIEWLDEAIPADAELDAAARELALGLGSGQINTLLKKFHEACAAPGVGGLLHKASYLKSAPSGAGLEVWRERPFAVPFTLPGMSGGAVVRGQIDRVVITRSGNRVVGAEVIDYKTDPVTGKTAGEKIAFYAPQISAYRTAVATMLGIDGSAVTTKIAFVGADIVREVR